VYNDGTAYYDRQTEPARLTKNAQEREMLTTDEREVSRGCGRAGADHQPTGIAAVADCFGSIEADKIAKT
jgi:hypothetical protein